MNIGFDFHRTIDLYPKEFSVLIGSLVSERNNISIISAVGKKVNTKNYRQRVVEFLEENSIPFHHFEIIVFQDKSEIPKLKLESCKRNEISMYFDDRADVCDILIKNNILSFKVGKIFRN
jgi:uncharacterized HAD superfamily protein